MADLTEEEILRGGKAVSGPAVKDAGAVEAPTGLTEADVMAGRQIKAAGITPTPKEGTAPSPGIGGQLLRQFGLTGRYALEGVGSALDLGAAPIATLLNMATGSDKFHTAGQNATTLADMIGLPKPQGALENVVGAGTRAGFGAMVPVGAANTVANTAASPVTQGTAKLVAANPGAQVTSTALGGVAGQSALEAGANPLVAAGINIGTTLGTNMLGQRIGNAMSGNYTLEGKRAMDLNAAAKREGVTLTAGDLGNRPAAALENFLQDVPLSGRDAFMQQQAGQTKAMLERLRASIPSGDAGKETIDALRTAYNNNRATASKFYDAVNTELAAVPGSDQLAMTSFQAAAKKFLKEYPKYMESPDTPQSVKDALQYAASGNLPYANYQLARDLRTMIGQEVRAAERAGKTVKGDLSQLFRALSDDFRDWSTGLTQTNPKAAAAYGQADQYFKQNVVPFKADTKIKKIVGDTTTADELDTLADGVMKNLFKLDSPGRANFALKLTGKPGESIAQGELVNRALTPALDPNLKAGVSPMRFVNTMNLQDPMVQSVISRNPALAKQLQTVSDIAEATRRAPTAFETPRTGVQNKALGTAVGLANPMTTLPTAAGLIGGRAANAALRTDPVKGFLFANGADPYSNLLPLLNAINNAK